MDESNRNIFFKFPPDNTIKPPAFPPRPDLFDEVEWGPFVTPEDAKLAHRLWDLPNTILGNAISDNGIFRRPNTGEEIESQELHALVNNVYEHLMQNHLKPPSEAEWERKWRETMHDRTWTIQEIFAPVQELRTQDPGRPILIQGYDVLTSPWWTLARLRQELLGRGLDHSGRPTELRRRLYDDERQSRGYALLPRSDLSYWGVNREDNFTIKISETNTLKPLDMYTWAIMLNPYNPAYWVSRAYCHYQQAFFDLAIGDAHRALLLCEVLYDALGRNRQPGLHPRIWHAIEQHILAKPRNTLTGEIMPTAKLLRCGNGVNYFIPTVRKALHNIISLSLSAISSWKDYSAMERYLKERLRMHYRDTSAFDRRQRVLEDAAAENERRRKEERLFFYEKRAGNVKGAKEYPYEAEDKDRVSLPLDLMNRNLFRDFPKCEVRVNVDDNSLYVTATEDIKKGSLIFAEEPSIRGHLNVDRLEEDKNKNRVKTRCENCRKEITSHILNRYQRQARAIRNGTHREACKCGLQEDGIPLHFCPANEQQGATCLEIARELYHHRVCGKNWNWLHDAMRPGKLNWSTFSHYPKDILRPDGSKDLSFFTHTHEAHGTMLSLLLREVFDITLIRRERTSDANLMAHEIDELLMLEDSKSWSSSWFPFTFAANIRVPFDILLQLGVDIFRDLTFDTWVIQTILRKLIINAVLWDEKWRGSVERVEQEKNIPKTDKQDTVLGEDQDFNVIDPSFQNLYLFAGFSLFNHACQGRHNANWGYDETIPNRVLVWAAEDVPRSTEIRIPYKFKPMSTKAALRILGRECQCPHCLEGNATDSSGEEDNGGGGQAENGNGNTGDNNDANANANINHTNSGNSEHNANENGANANAKMNANVNVNGNSNHTNHENAQHNANKKGLGYGNADDEVYEINPDADKPLPGINSILANANLNAHPTDNTQAKLKTERSTPSQVPQNPNEHLTDSTIAVLRIEGSTSTQGPPSATLLPSNPYRFDPAALAEMRRNMEQNPDPMLSRARVQAPAPAPSFTEYTTADTQRVASEDRFKVADPSHPDEFRILGVAAEKRMRDEGEGEDEGSRSGKRSRWG